MAVNGPGGPKPATPPPATPVDPGTTTAATGTSELLDPVDTKSPVLDTQDDSIRPGWQPRTGRYRPPENPAAAPLTADAEMAQAIDRYQQRLLAIFGTSAMTLARGPSATPDAELSPTQRSDLVRATEDLLRDVPIGKLSPGFADEVQQALAAKGISRDVSTTRLGDLGQLGGQLAKKWATDMRESNPAEFYALGAGAAAAAGYAAWDKGSAGLRQLGLRPEVKSQVFDPHFSVRGGVDFDPHFKNVTGRVQADYNLPDFHLSAVGDIDTRGRLDTFSVGAGYSHDGLGVNVQATEKNGRLDNASATVLYNTPNFALSAGAAYSAETRRTTAGVEAEWKPQKNVDFALSASKNDQGVTYVGVGFRQSF